MAIQRIVATAFLAWVLLKPRSARPLWWWTWLMVSTCAVGWIQHKANKLQFGWRWLWLRTLAWGYKSIRLVSRCFGGGRLLQPWENPRVFRSPSILPAHAPLRVYDSIQQALTDPSNKHMPFPFDAGRPAIQRRYLCSPWTRTLDSVESTEPHHSAPVCGGGGWQFLLVPSPEHVPGGGGYPPGIPASLRMLPNIRGQPAFVNPSSRDIVVPGSWELQGHGTPIYTNIEYPWLREPHHTDGASLAGGQLAASYHAGKVPAHANPTGIYRRLFDIPDGWQRELESGTRVLVLCLGAVSSACRIFLNGEEVGYCQDSFVEAEVDITDQVSGEFSATLLASNLSKTCMVTSIRNFCAEMFI